MNVKGRMMKMIKNTIFFLMIYTFLFFNTCSTRDGTLKGSRSARTFISTEDTQISALGGIGRTETIQTGPMFEGDGGSDILLAVLAPEVGDDVPGYLPVYIQGLLNNNFKRYSAINIVDRQNLDKIITEQDLGANNRFSDKDFISIGNLTNARFFLFGTIQRLSGERYSLQLSITDINTGIRKADSMKDGVLAQFEGNGTLINEASAELLAQMGVHLTKTGEKSLKTGNRSVVQAEAGLARGIAAQAGGADVAALLNFSQAIAFDPSQIEALKRLNKLSSTIAEGTISQRILNDIQARDRWLDAFKEVTRYFNEHPPFEIIFDPNLVQEGDTDYVKRTAVLGMRIALDPSKAGFDVLNALLEGLEKTGRRNPWGFSGWPLFDTSPQSPGTVVFNGRQSFDFKVDVTLLNDKHRKLDTGTITLTTAALGFSAGDVNVKHPSGIEAMVLFSNVKVDKLTPTLQIVITAVNGIPSARINSTGYMKIDSGWLEWRKQFVKIPGGTFTIGSPTNEPERKDDEGPQHRVTISPFYMDKYEVTQKEWNEVMSTTIAQQKEAQKLWEQKQKDNPFFIRRLEKIFLTGMKEEIGDAYPMYYVSWHDAVKYCNWRSLREGLNPAYIINENNVTWNRNANGYRLPTEAEWEYTCRAGTTTAYNNGATIISDTGWYYSNSGGSSFMWNRVTKLLNLDYWAHGVHLAGAKPANVWGLYDMHGNVSEWCWDWYGNYASEAQTDPEGVSSGTARVYRSGSWEDSAKELRSAKRFSEYPSERTRAIGFRLARNGQ